MRMMASRYQQPKPVQIKRQVANVKHVSAPLKGLSLSSKLVPGDPLTATVLDNWVVEENQVKSRAGTLLRYADAAARPVETLVPFYGQPSKLAAATNGQLRLFDGTLVQGGFTGNDWSWTSFSNLSAVDYTIMVNGRDGVWSWDGADTSTDPAPVAVTSLSNANPAVVTVAAADIGKFSNGMLVTIAGADSGHAAANGPHAIGSVGAPANTFTLLGVDTSAATGAQTTGVTADPASTGVVKEALTVPPSAPWVVPDQFNIVLAHMNRLWFADSSNLMLYYLPVQQKSGQLAVLPLSAVFKRGGSIRAMYTWTTEGGVNLNDQLVIFSTNGEAAIYGGVDPATDFQLSGLFRFDSPMSKHSVIAYGGELYCLISTGLVPMSTLMRAESEQLGQQDRNVFSAFFDTALNHRDAPGWQVLLNPSSGRMIANLPQGGTTYSQMVRFMPNPVWATWSGMPSRCWGWVNNRLFMGADDGKVYEMHPAFLNDNGQPIRVDVQPAWSNYGTPASKQFKMVLPYLQSDGEPHPYLDMRVDYDMRPATNQPDVSFGSTGAVWDLADWDTATWAGSMQGHNNWTGVTGNGRVGAPRLTALIKDCQLSLTGWDVLFETGSIFG